MLLYREQTLLILALVLSKRLLVVSQHATVDCEINETTNNKKPTYPERHMFIFHHISVNKYLLITMRDHVCSDLSGNYEQLSIQYYIGGHVVLL